MIKMFSIQLALATFIDMMKQFFLLLILMLLYKTSFPQNLLQNKVAKAWADSVFNTLSDTERIAQLMVVRLSTYDFKNKRAVFFDKQVDSLVREYNIGS